MGGFIMTNGTSGSAKTFFAAVTKRPKIILGKSKNQVREKVRRKKIKRRSVVLFRCWSTNKVDIEIRMIPNQNRYFKLDKIHFFLLRNACRRFLESNNLST